MDMKHALTMVLLLATPGGASVHLNVSPGPLAPEAIARTEAAAAKLLEAPARDPFASGLVINAASWKRDLPPARRQALLDELRALWGKRLAVRETAAPAAAQGPVPPASALEFRDRTDALRARLDAAPRPLERGAQDRFYDGGRAGPGSAVAATGGSFAPAAARRAAFSPAPPRLRTAPPPPPSARKAASPISWKRAGWEFLKGAGHAVAEVFTWKGLAVAAASIALVTVAPVAIYGFLVVGAAFAGWTIGKALVNGRAAYKAGDAEKFYGASREMGRGALALTMTVIGARHAPTNLKPHFPRGTGEWRAMAAAVDDEPIIAMSILRDRVKKP